jgi:signal transduction histidine kinase
VRPYAIQMDVSVILTVRSDAVIMADPTDMEIIFNNLVSNSVKYNKRGGKVEVIIDKDGNDVIIIFSDTGIGIKEEDRENLFAEFVRIKNEKTKNISGSGLGLSIVKKVVELYNGTISVDSIPDVGTTFTVRLPRKTN